MTLALLPSDRLENRLEAERTIGLDRYAEDGCYSRVEYLKQIAEGHDLSLADIEPIVDSLGPDEDFDGLVVFLEDHADRLGGEC